MTCTHVLDLIDAGPFADYPRAHLDAAWQHARQCATCGPALETATAFTADLAVLPRPAPPPDLAVAVLARIAQIEPANPTATTAATSEVKALAGRGDWSAWATTALGGVGAGVAILLSTPLGDVMSSDMALPGVRGMTAGLAAMPSTTTGALVLAAGLVLYVAGLFGPLSGRSHR